MPRTVLSVSFPLARVGPDAVGGAEQVLSALDRALTAAGDHSIVVAPEGSVVSGTLLATPPAAGILDDQAWAAAHAAHRRAIAQALHTYPVDVVHLHGLDFADYLPAEPAPPVLATLHLDPLCYPASIFSTPRPNLVLQCVSNSQLSRCPASQAPLLEPIPNGVALDRFTPATRKADFALALSRICPEKGLHLAAAAARQAGVPLVLAGQVYPYPAHLDYFEHCLRPLLDGRQVRFVGAVGGARKRRLLALARCVVIASQVPETSSLVAMEALACGTPVVALRVGALPEIVEHGRTGFLVDSVEELADAIHAAARLDAGACRQAAEARFSVRQMAGRYLQRYARLAARARPITPPERITVTELSSVEALERVRAEWMELWQRVPGASIFQHPDWLIPWCQPFGVRQPWLLLLRDHQRLVGLAPWLVYPRGAERVLTLMGGGISDDQNVLIDPTAPRAALAAMWRHLAEHGARFTTCELENVPAGSPLLGEPAPGWSARGLVANSVRPVLRIPPATASLRQAIPGTLWKEISYLRRRAERDGLPVSVTRASATTFEECFAELVRLHGLRWAARGQAGMLSPALAQFHRQVGQRLLERGLLRLYVLRLGQRVASAFYGFSAGGRTVYYLGGFDPDRDLQRYSPGTLVIAHALQVAVEQDHATAFDFLRGAEPYKYAWGATDDAVYRRVLGPRSQAEDASVAA